MKKIFALLVLFLLLVSCNGHEGNLKTMETKCNQEFDDSIFKANLKIRLYERRAVGYDTINDSYFYNKIKDYISNHLISSQYDLISTYKESKDYFETSLSFSGGRDKDDIKELNRVNKELHTAILNLKKYNKLYDFLDKRKYEISNNRYYLYKEYIKATITDNRGKSINKMGITMHLFNSKLNMFEDNDSIPRYIMDRMKKIGDRIDKMNLEKEKLGDTSKEIINDMI
jgi:hypothetical protein